MDRLNERRCPICRRWYPIPETAGNKIYCGKSCKAEAAKLRKASEIIQTFLKPLER